MVPCTHVLSKSHDGPGLLHLLPLILAFQFLLSTSHNKGLKVLTNTVFFFKESHTQTQKVTSNPRIYCVSNVVNSERVTV
ncbi:hypothetical protein INR49_018366 [Caranx melampygus]|nr:hypothetical protein INR49_018366 [Caranx melampygus]